MSSAISAEEILEELVRRIARAVVAEMRADRTPTDGWLDQHSTEAAFGVRWHCRAVRRRRAEGKPGAAIEGRRYLLTREAMNEEALRSGQRDKGVPTTSERDAAKAAVIVKLKALRPKSGSR
jgi:hypothetical protein